MEKLLSQLNEVGIHNENIFLAGFSAGGWTALMAAKACQTVLIRGVLFAPAFAGLVMRLTFSQFGAKF